MRKTDAEVHQSLLHEVFENLVDAQRALDIGDMEELALSLAGAGFELCCALPERYAERAPAAWFECQS